jgi:hypothetical protein
MKSRQQQQTLQHEGIEWIELGQAAKLSRTKAVVISEQIAAASICCHVQEGRTYIPLTTANRLKRETATMLKVKRLNKAKKLPPGRNFGVLVKDTHDVLPISNGRADRGWLGTGKT